MMATRQEHLKFSLIQWKGKACVMPAFLVKLPLCGIFFPCIPPFCSAQSAITPEAPFSISGRAKQLLTDGWPLWLSIQEAQLPLDAPARNLMVVMSDGLRWQEVFRGADSALMAADPDKVRLFKQYYHPDTDERRKLLMPFLWSVMVREGAFWGNRDEGSRMSVSNRVHISYPGYSEMICGFTDDKRLHSNRRITNPNSNVLDWLQTQAGLRHRVVAVGSWVLFNWILHRKSADYPINAGFSPLSDEAFINQKQAFCTKPWNNKVRPDTLTWQVAEYYLHRCRPRVLFLGFGETDEYAHDANYGAYLDVAHRFDSLLHCLWRILQQTPQYRHQTALMVSTDHGRGRRDWAHHHRIIPGSDETWMALSFPEMAATGIQKNTGKTIRQEQLAATMAALLGYHYRAGKVASALALEKRKTYLSGPFFLQTAAYRK
jgi:hypothetical protein